MDYFGNINIYGENSKIFLNATPDEHNPFNGFICNDYVASDVVYGDILFFDINQGQWRKACANDVKTLPARGISCGSYTKIYVKVPILMYGFFYYPDTTKNILSSQLWLSDSTPGLFTDERPYLYGNYCQTLGMAKTSQIYFFDFCPFYIKLG